MIEGTKYIIKGDLYDEEGNKIITQGLKFKF